MSGKDIDASPMVMMMHECLRVLYRVLEIGSCACNVVCLKRRDAAIGGKTRFRKVEGAEGFV